MPLKPTRGGGTYGTDRKEIKTYRFEGTGRQSGGDR